MKLKGNTQIGMRTGPGPNEVRITIEDELSGCRVIEITLSLESWAKALANRFVECEFELSESPHIGKRLETKIMQIAHPNPSDYMKKSDAKLAAALKPHEIDGWTGNIEDFRNHQLEDKITKKYNIRFVRWEESKP